MLTRPGLHAHGRIALVRPHSYENRLHWPSFISLLRMTTVHLNWISTTQNFSFPVSQDKAEAYTFDFPQLLKCLFNYIQ